MPRGKKAAKTGSPAKTNTRLAPKRKAATKPTPKITKRKAAAEPETPIPTKKQKKDTKASGSTPEWDKNVRTQSQRRKSGFHMTRASLLDESINEHSVANLFKDMKSSSFTKMTWGESVDGGTQAPRSRRARKLQVNPFSATGTVEQRYNQLMDHMRELIPVRKAIQNDPSRTPLLRLSYEIREGIYKYLLVSETGIMIKPDLKTVERKVAAQVGILLTCKLLNAEGTTYLVMNNDVRVLFRKTSRAHDHSNIPILLTKGFTSYFRDVTFDFSAECWSPLWYQKATDSIQSLCEAGAAISRLTIVVAPKRVGMSETALGLQSSQITFADLFWYDGKFMVQVRELHPRRMRIIVRSDGARKLVTDLDLTYLNALWIQTENLMNEVTEEILLGRERELDTKLRGLMDMFECTFEAEMASSKASTFAATLVEDNVRSHAKQSCVSDISVPNDGDLRDGTVSEKTIESVVFEEDPQAICTDIETSDMDE